MKKWIDSPLLTDEEKFRLATGGCHTYNIFFECKNLESVDDVDCCICGGPMIYMTKDTWKFEINQIRRSGHIDNMALCLLCGSEWYWGWDV